MAVIRFKRATAARWKELNPVLDVGEPGFECDKNKLKIGDGMTAWMDLSYLGEDNVVNANTHYDFPSVGKENVIYKAESEKKIYQWNKTDLRYELLGDVQSGEDVSDIKLINGGNANGINN